MIESEYPSKVPIVFQKHFFFPNFWQFLKNKLEFIFKTHFYFSLLNKKICQKKNLQYYSWVFISSNFFKNIFVFINTIVMMMEIDEHLFNIVYINVHFISL